MGGGQLFTPDEICDWISGETYLASGIGQWRDLELRARVYQPWGGPVPALRDYLVTCFGRTGKIRRRCGGGWQTEIVERGTVTLIPRGVPSDWHWEDTIESTHLYIGEAYLSKIAGHVFDASRCEVEFVDQLKIIDPEISAAMEALAREARERDKAEHLYVDAIATQISIQVLRRYSSLRVQVPKSFNGLKFAQEQRLARYIDERLHENLSILQLCDVAGISPCHFVRLFKKSFGLPPHKYLVQKRLEQVCRLLKESDTPLKRVAAICGFYDQAHMTRLFKENYNLTPKQFRDL